MTDEQKIFFPQLIERDFVDFFNSINIDSLESNGSFDKKYSFGSVPKEYEADNEECPDLLMIFKDGETNKYRLLQNNSFFVNEDIGCAESSTIYLLSIKKGKLLLNKIDYAGQKSKNVC
ncbi:MAG: hypothetical protein AAF632_27920 [Bacteroidota bacterium]